MQKYRAIFSVDTSLFNPLDGTYSIEKYILMPCSITRKNQELGCSNFVLQFDFEGLNEKDV